MNTWLENSFNYFKLVRKYIEKSKKYSLVKSDKRL